MAHCYTDNCYGEMNLYFDAYDIDINMRDFLEGIFLENVFNFCLFLFLTYISFLFLKSLYKSDHLNISNDITDHCKYERKEWPYYSEEQVPSDLEERMKFWEKLSRQITEISPEYPFIVRLDGCCFSEFTRKLKQSSSDKVFSTEFRDAMIDTACDLLMKFRPTTVYTHSDEITLVFKDNTGYDDDNNKIVVGNHYRNGKVYKLLSEIPSFASVAFTRNIQRCYHNNTEVLDFLSKQYNVFDARVIVFPLESTYEVANHMIWRTRDCYRNYVSAFAEKYLGKRKLDHVSTTERVEQLKNKSIDLTDETNLDSKSMGMKYGTFLKLFKANKTKILIQAFYSTKLEFSEELVDFLLYSMKDLEYETDTESSSRESESYKSQSEESSADQSNSSEVANDTHNKTYFSIDSYAFEDVFNGTFTLGKDKK